MLLPKGERVLMLGKSCRVDGQVYASPVPYVFGYHPQSMAPSGSNEHSFGFFHQDRKSSGCELITSMINDKRSDETRGAGRSTLKT